MESSRSTISLLDSRARIELGEDFSEETARFFTNDFIEEKGKGSGEK